MKFFLFFKRPVCLIFSGMVSGIALFLLLFSSFSFADLGVQNEGIPQDENVILGGVERSAIHPSCLDNWTDWPHSDRLKEDIPWTLQFIPYENLTQLRKYRREFFIDINDDGLQDYIYARKILEGFGSPPLAEECVALNTGGTWNVIFKCRAFGGNFYGDCADTD